ncbi:hypothetical protein CVT26_003004 [Gymnopilus dilepis]|uniref:Uncharacterized protein n=1 Tax=Gymnopilus dilepis TaxID=231916 RepID=A0A409WT08_9AGAR|nr:hypothetical protein CVT26_003004 [Gymnopilus dilepis]
MSSFVELERETPPHLSPAPRHQSPAPHPQSTTPPQQTLDPAIAQDDDSDADQEYALVELQDFRSPVAVDEITDGPFEVVSFLPTLKAPMRYQSNLRLATRRKEALVYASTYLRRQIDSNPDLVFTRHMANDRFPSIDRGLTDLLTQIKRVETNRGDAFTIDKKFYSPILSGIYTMIKELGQYLLIDGYAIPELPRWGKDGDINVYHLENEYEILAIAFRTEVEQCVALFDKVYDFAHAKPRSQSLISYGENHRSGRSFLVGPPEHSPDITRMIHSPEPATSTPANRRRSSMYAYNKEGITKLRDATQAVTRDKPPTRTLRSFSQPSR